MHESFVKGSRPHLFAGVAERSRRVTPLDMLQSVRVEGLEVYKEAQLALEVAIIITVQES